MWVEFKKPVIRESSFCQSRNQKGQTLSAPSSDVTMATLREREVYLKLGADAHSRARQAMSTAAYTSRKEMVTMLAMVLSFPEKRTSWRRREGEKKKQRIKGLTFRATIAFYMTFNWLPKNLNVNR